MMKKPRQFYPELRFVNHKRVAVKFDGKTHCYKNLERQSFSNIPPPSNQPFPTVSVPRILSLVDVRATSSVPPDFLPVLLLPAGAHTTRRAERDTFIEFSDAAVGINRYLQKGSRKKKFRETVGCAQPQWLLES